MYTREACISGVTLGRLGVGVGGTGVRVGCLHAEAFEGDLVAIAAHKDPNKARGELRGDLRDLGTVDEKRELLTLDANHQLIDCRALVNGKTGRPRLEINPPVFLPLPD